LEVSLKARGTDASRFLRLDVHLPNVHYADAANGILRRKFQYRAAIVIYGAELEDHLASTLSAITI